MREYIITISNVNTGEFFFTTDHCQPHQLGSEWVSCTYGPLPGHVVARESLPSGLVENKEDYKKVFVGMDWCPAVEIPNPNPLYQA